MNDFPELELDRLRKELLELRLKVEKYEAVLKDNDLLDAVPSTSEMEEICVREISRFNQVSKKSAALSLEDHKILDLLHKNLLLARGKAVPVEKDTKNKKKESVDVAKLLKLAGTKDLDE